MKFTLNGEAREYTGDPERSLMTVLREDLGVTSPKDGCAPQAACGCCTVWLGEKAVLSCVTPMRKAEGKAVVTTEGLDPATADAFAKAFVKCGGVQCGFCIPGIVMRGAKLCEKKPEPSVEDVEKSLNFHLCRCTGYKKIVESVQVAAEAIRTGTPVELPPQTGKVGTSLPKYDSERLVLGQRPYVADMNIEGQLHGAMRWSDHPRARVLKIDPTKALAMPGVERVILAEDVPGKRNVGLIVWDWPVIVAAGEVTRYTGDVLAVVLADTRERAYAAAAAVEVEYEVLEPVLDMFEAKKPDAPKVHEGGNLLSTSKARKGDFEKAWAECDFTVEGTWVTQRVEHAFMEPEAAVALPEGGGIKIYTQSQGIYQDRDQLASLLDLPKTDVKVILVPNGGGFGGKEDLSIQGQTALAAHLTGRPVKVEITRAESLKLHPKRHPLHMKYWIGATKDGKLHAVRSENHGDTGAYASVGMKVLERSVGHATGAYFCPNVRADAYTLYTNNVPCGAFRGFGANQANFALECAIDELCEKAGFDRWQFRYDNALVAGLSTATGQVLEGGVGVRKCLEAVKEAFQAAPYAGIACGLKNTGIGNGMPDEGTAKVVIKGPEHVEVHHGWTDMGQGCDTMAVQYLCELTGIPPEYVEVRVDTREEVPCGMTTASRATSLIGNALIECVKPLQEDLKTRSLADLVGKEYFGKWTCDWTTKPGKEGDGPVVTHYSYSYACQVVILKEDGEIEKVIAAHDAGRIVNPTLFEGQIEGSVHMGLGYALTEDVPIKENATPSGRLNDYGVLRARKTPPIEVIGVEEPDPHGPLGAKGVGEIGLVPTAPAVANAFYMLEGKRYYSLPMRAKGKK